MKSNEKIIILDHDTLSDLVARSAYVIARTLDKWYADRDQPGVTLVVRWHHWF